MNLKELYLAGINFESFIGTGTKTERDRFPKNYSRVEITSEEIEKIKKIDKKINFLVSGEVWCTDFQLNVTALKKICELNDKLEISIITKGRGEKYLKSILGLEEFRVPVIVPLNENFEMCGKVFIERPNKIKNIIFEEIKMEYLKGKYLRNTIEELIEIINISC
ncbi:MAG: thioredoxin family protein [Fusobacteriaceae bacterium]